MKATELQDFDEKGYPRHDSSASNSHFFTEEESFLETFAEARALKLVWKDIHYEVSSKTDTATLLNKVSGSANPGQVLAIMGTSGSGKTTLLNLLAGSIPKRKGHSISGSITANGKSVYDFDYRHFAAYVPQDDILVQSFTVQEALEFSLDVRTQLSTEEKRQRVDVMLRNLHLDHIRFNRIGGVLEKGISGGQRKRLCIGLELIVNPLILLLDEPTSGLDSYSAYGVISLLKDVANSGRTVVMTIHQPSYDIFQLINRLILVSRGSFVYQGDRARARKHFKSTGFECPAQVNLPDYFMHILYVKDRRNLTEEEFQRLGILSQGYEANKNKLSSARPRVQLSDIETLEPESVKFSKKYWFLLKRSFKISIRDKQLLSMKVGQVLFLVIFVDMLYGGLSDDYSSAQDRSGMIFNTMIMSVFFSSQNSFLSCNV